MIGGPQGIYTGCDPTPVAHFGHGYGVGFSRCVSVGNQADVHAAELLHDMAAHDETAVSSGIR